MATSLCAALAIAAAVLHKTDVPYAAKLAMAAAVGAYVAGGLGPTRRALQSLRHGDVNVDLLMIAAALGAALIGDWLEGAVLLFLFSLSGALEDYASYRTKRSIESLVKLRPREATLVAAGVEDRVVSVDDLAIGQIVRVRPGERFPVDGRVVEGETWADEATLTGESEPVDKGVGAAVFAGTINGQGSVLVEMTRAVADTTLERIVHMVQVAQAEKTPTLRFVESWQRPY
ncbi:MAG TPA: heavy metal translocating P-type ATPase, partial [Lacipirellulaceae bacterium]|nr:heavy metal translocating P-type ATPase [Lacipirellulaceae bacterium]